MDEAIFDRRQCGNANETLRSAGEHLPAVCAATMGVTLMNQFAVAQHHQRLATAGFVILPRQFPSNCVRFGGNVLCEGRRRYP